MRAMRSSITRWGSASGAAVVLMFSLAATALAVSILLPPGGSVAVPATTAATEPSLAGGVIHDALLPFTIKSASGAVVCAGQLQDRVVRSNTTGQLDFYYRIHATTGPGAIGRTSTASFSSLPLRVGYRTDGLGTVAPKVAARSAAPGAQMTFSFDPALSCARHQESRFILIRTPAKKFVAGGSTRVIATTGVLVSLPTVRP